MWLDEMEEILKGFIPYYVLVFLSIFIIVSPVNPVSGAHEIPVFRMQHYDLSGVSYGSRSAAVNLEARSIATWSTSRHCVITRLVDLTLEMYRNIRGKAGALIVELPQSFSNFTQDEKQQLLQLENKMLLEQETPIPVYFCKHHPTINGIISELAQNTKLDVKRKSAVDAMFSQVSASGYQVSISSPASVPKADSQIATFQGHLVGYRPDGKVPTIVIVAHYDSFGVAPDMSFGADSNGSGLVIMLELIRLLSGLYSVPKTRGKYNIVFVLSGGGKLNYQGSKKWLEDQLEAADSPLLQEPAFIMCLDTLTTSDTIFMHVAKPPKEGSAASTFYKILKSEAENVEQPPSIEGVYKKVNLVDELFAWEHERFSEKKQVAFTLSCVKNYKDPWRTTILDDASNLNEERLIRHAKVIINSIGRFVYDIPDSAIFGGHWDVHPGHIKTWKDYLAGQPRSAQLLTSKEHPLMVSLQNYLNTHLRDVKATFVAPEKRDPDFQFFGNTVGTMNIYSVKPAIFDLILTFAITAYLVSVYFAISYFPALYGFCCSLMKNQKIKTR